MLRGLSTTARTSYDVVIVGGGVVGLSSAYHLAQKLGDGAGICVLERDAQYRRASAVLSAGGIRQQFSGVENIAMSQYGIRFLTDELQQLRCAADTDAEPVDLQFFEGGYLFLAGSDSGLRVLHENHATQLAAGHPGVELLEPADVAARFPWMSVDGVLAGSHGTKDEGWFDPWSLISALRRKVCEMGVTIDDTKCVGMRSSTSAVAGAVGEGSASGRRVEAVELKDGRELRCGTVVNAAGAFSHEVVGMALGSEAAADGFEVRPRRRCIFNFHCLDKSVVGCPLTIDPSGVWFRQEGNGGGFLTGVSPPEEDDPDWPYLRPTEDVDEDLWMGHIWPTIAERVPAFEQVKVRGAWAGLYEYNVFDQNAIIGRHPGCSNLVLANGFSGHGLQQSPATGRAVSELIADGGFTTLDLSCFGYERILEGRHMFEKNIV
jgi:FAD-dependent oxidoreductase domain-containing protein 1